MIPPHTCTPFCTGQRYCVEEGTHTLVDGWYKGKSLDDWRRLYKNELGVEVLRAVECPDLRPQDINAPHRPVDSDDVGYLVTVKES